MYGIRRLPRLPLTLAPVGFRFPLRMRTAREAPWAYHTWIKHAKPDIKHHPHSTPVAINFSCKPLKVALKLHVIIFRFPLNVCLNIKRQYFFISQIILSQKKLDVPNNLHYLEQYQEPCQPSHREGAGCVFLYFWDSGTGCWRCVVGAGK